MTGRLLPPGARREGKVFFPKLLEVNNNREQTCSLANPIYAVCPPGHSVTDLPQPSNPSVHRLERS